MENNNPTSAPQSHAPIPPQGYTDPMIGPPPIPVVPQARPKPVPRVYSTAEKLLLPVALLVAILFDRLLIAPLFDYSSHLSFFSSIFWLAFLVAYYIFYWNKLRHKAVLWLVGGLTGALCVWSFFFDYRTEYGMLNFLVIPAVLMAHMQFLAGDYKLKEVGKIAGAWVLGWVVKPFIGINHCIGSAGAVSTGGQKSQLKRVFIGVGIALPLLLIIVPLLGSADRVFAYYITQVLRDFNIGYVIVHTFLVALAMLLIYSVLWAVGFEGKPQAKPAQAVKQVQIDGVISCIVLGSIVAVYLLFCMVQFTYLFARAGLPGEMTYSEYAREGFSQMIAVCSINLLIFGVFLQYGKRNKAVMVLLVSLLALTGVMLISSFVRLHLYIDTYGLTWLRLLSGWFILYLGAVILLCGARMVKESIPLIAVCSFLLLGWYVILGYANPDALIVRYNLRTAESPMTWLEENERYVARLSDNALLTLLDKGASETAIVQILEEQPWRRSGHSLSSRRLARRFPVENGAETASNADINLSAQTVAELMGQDI